MNVQGHSGYPKIVKFPFHLFTLVCKIAKSYCELCRVSVHPSVCSRGKTGAVTGRILTKLTLYAPCILYKGQAYCYSPEYAFYVYSKEIYI